MTLTPIAAAASLLMLAGCPAPDDPDMNADSTSASSGAAGSSGSASPATTTAANDESSAGEDSASTSDGPDSGGSSGGTPGGSNDTDTMLAIGDSVLEWNAERGASIPEVAGELAGLAVTNASVSGAMLLEDEESIPSQYQPSDWEWVLVNGGANDVGDGCGCGDCVGQVDAIISADVGDGAMVELIDRIEADGAGIVLLGYYDIPPGEFSDCDEEFAILHERYAQLASQRPAVLYVSMGDAIDPLADPETLDEDQIHPSVQGSAAIGALIAERIQP